MSNGKNEFDGLKRGSLDRGSLERGSLISNSGTESLGHDLGDKVDRTMEENPSFRYSATEALDILGSVQKAYQNLVDEGNYGSAIALLDTVVEYGLDVTAMYLEVLDSLDEGSKLYKHAKEQSKKRQPEY